MSVQTVPLGDTLDFFNGKAPTKADDGDFVVFGSNGTIGHSKSFNYENAIILGRVGAYCGSVAICHDKFWASDNTIVVKPKNGIDLRYMYYRLLSSPLRSYAGGAAQPLITHTILRGIKRPVHLEPRVQSRIAKILSTYDDLIENNRRRIQLLEAAARLLYKEWFVHLRFPGHEHIKITDGVPEGWARKPLAKIAENVSYGLTASSSVDEIGPKFLRITDIVPTNIDWDQVPFCEAEDAKIQRNRLGTGDVVVARTGATVGYAKRISHLPADAVYASYLVRFRFDDPDISLIAGIYMESASYKDFVKNHAGGAAQPNANAKVLGSAPLLIPTRILKKQFSESVTPLIKQRDLLISKNALLARARDLLLPRLMNGEIPV